MREALKQFSDVRFPRRGNSTVIAFGRIATSIDAISMIKSDLGKGAATMLQFAIFANTLIISILSPVIPARTVSGSCEVPAHERRAKW